MSEPVKRKRAPAGCMKCPSCDGDGKEHAYVSGCSLDNPATMLVDCSECGGSGFVYNPDSPTNAEYEKHLSDQHDSSY